MKAVEILQEIERTNLVPMEEITKHLDLVLGRTLTPSIVLQEVKSTNIEMIGFDNSSSTLRVKFKNGTFFDYEDVPFEIFTELKEHTSLGRAFNKLIKGKYEDGKK